MKKSKVSNGVYWVEVPDHDLRILCGSPADTVKHLMRRGFITKKERDGVGFETGPNVILLSDVSIQNGEFANLAEFPVLQMFYRQGMIIPGHPNNSGRRPIILGAADQVAAQREYIFRGNYGLVSEEELRAAGLDKATARERMRIKKIFAFGAIRRPEEMIDFRVIAAQPVEIAPGVTIERTAFNTFMIATKDESEEISLDLERNEHYEPPYGLGQNKIKPEYFSVVHTGEGDGWDTNRPCMASVLVFQGRVYLIDAGPSVIHSLNSLGISVNEIDGIFHTHAHDDHFAGLTSLVRADHRIPYYATQPVRHSVMKKLSALMSFPEERFEEFFISFDLELDTWNMIDGLEVKPVYSPHPVETTILFFRALWSDGYKTYAHFADICSFEQLDHLVEESNPASRKLIETVRADYLTPVDVKKLDIGGGMIHGVAEDFRLDTSKRIVLSHKADPLTPSEKEIGADTSFGMTDILIKTTKGGFEHHVFHLLRANFPGAPEHELSMLANGTARTMSVGSILTKKHTSLDAVYLLLNGLIEIIDTDRDIQNTVTAGTMIGERNCLFDLPVERTYRAASFVRILEIPARMYRAFIERSDLTGSMREYLDRKFFLEGTYLLGDRISGVTHITIAQEIVRHEVSRGEQIVPKDTVVLLVSGRVELSCNGRSIGVVLPGDSFGEAKLFGNGEYTMDYRAAKKSVYYEIHYDTLRQIPVVRWKLLEQFNRRIRTCSTERPV